MDFLSIIIFLILYFVRPQEWISVVTALKPVMASVAFAIFAMFNRERPLSVRDFFRTPHDWLMLIYFAWVVFSSHTPWDTFLNCYNVFVFYYIIVQALSDTKRIQKFLSWWTVMLLVVAGMALLSEVHIDPTGSYDMTHGMMKDCRVLNTYLFNNPNALGHSIVPCILMVYYICYWKRPIFTKIASVPLFAIAVGCIYLTVSKGSFLSAFATFVVAYSFGRPKIVQISILVLAVCVGYGALYKLPRMNELKKAQSDEAIKGRLAAWKFGLETMETQARGVGLGNFKQEFFKRNHYSKAGHSSYVQIGSEMGYTGLFIFLGILYCNLRVLVTSRATNYEEERIRRILFVLTFSFIVSSWMVDFGFRATYFLMAAATAAFHRLMLAKNEPEAAKEEIVEVESEPISIGLPPFRAPALPTPAPAMAAALSMNSFNQMAINVPAEPEQDESLPEQMTIEPGSKIGNRWRRIGIIDLVIMSVLLVAAVKFWRYMMYHI